MLMRRFADLQGLLHLGLTRSLVWLAIKVATAGLTCLAYVILGRSIDQPARRHEAARPGTVTARLTARRTGA